MDLNVSSILGFYGSDEASHYVFRHAVRLKENVTKECLEKAVQISMQRYPYHSIEVKAKDDDGNYCIEHNDRHVVVTKAQAAVKLLSKAANYHMHVICYKGHNIFFDVHKAFAEPVMYMKFVKTVIYYYLIEKYHCDLNTVGIRLADSRLHAGECDDPLNTLEPEVLDEIESEDESAEIEDELEDEDCGNEQSFIMKFSDFGYEKKKTLYRIEMDEKSFVQYSKQRDGSPAAVLSSFMFKAISNVHPDLDREIVCGMYHNARHATDNLKTHCNISNIVTVPYSPKLKDKDVPFLATVTRGRVIINSEDEVVRKGLEDKVLQCREVLAESGLENKRRVAHSIMERKYKNITYQIKYIGKILFGNLEPYIESMYTYEDTGIVDLRVVINVIHNRFCISFMKEFSNDVYVKEFVRILEETGIVVDVAGPKDNRTPEVDAD